MSNTALAVIGDTRNLRSLLEQKQEALRAFIPEKANLERFIAKVVSMASRHPDLLECTMESVYSAIHQCAQLNLETGPFGYVYLIPRRNKHRDGAKECNFQLGYKGLMVLARRHPDVEWVNGWCIYEGDGFSFDQGNGELSHTYSFSVDRSDSKIIGAYARAKLKGMDYLMTVVLTRQQIEAARKRSMASNSGPWITDYPAMARKTAIRALLNGGAVPMSAELADQIGREIEEEIKHVEHQEIDEVSTGTAALKHTLKRRQQQSVSAKAELDVPQDEGTTFEPELPAEDEPEDLDALYNRMHDLAELRAQQRGAPSLEQIMAAMEKKRGKKMAEWGLEEVKASIADLEAKMAQEVG